MSQHPNRLQFLKSYQNPLNLISQLQNESNPASLLKSISSSNKSNICHFILQNESIIQDQNPCLQFMQFTREKFSIQSLRWLLRFENGRGMTPIDKFLKLHACHELLVVSMEKDLCHLERLYRDMKVLQDFMHEHRLMESGSSEQAVKLLEVKNVFINEKNHLLMKVQRISQGEELAKMKILNHLFQCAYELRIVARRDSSCCLRILNCDKHAKIKEFYSNYDEMLNARYANRILSLLEKPPKEYVDIQRTHDKLLKELDENKLTAVHDSWRMPKTDDTHTTALRHLFDSEQIFEKEYEKDPQKLIEFLVEKKMMKQEFAPQVGFLVAYLNHNMCVKHLARIVELPVEDEITVSSWMDGEELRHKLTETPNLLWQNVAFFKGDLEQIRYFFRKKMEQKYNLNGQKLKSSHEKEDLPKGMTDEEEKRLNTTMEEVQRLLAEARGSLDKMKVSEQ